MQNIKKHLKVCSYRGGSPMGSSSQESTRLFGPRAPNGSMVSSLPLEKIRYNKTGSVKRFIKIWAAYVLEMKRWTEAIPHNHTNDYRGGCLPTLSLNLHPLAEWPSFLSLYYPTATWIHLGPTTLFFASWLCFECWQGYLQYILVCKAQERATWHSYWLFQWWSC